jgi:hypothetical protein
MFAADRSRLIFPAMRFVIPLLGLAAIAWAASVCSITWLDSDVTKIAARIVSGDRFRNDIWKSIESKFRNISHQSVKPSVLAKLAIIQLRGVETVLSAENGGQVEPRLAELTALSKAALRNTPTDGFLWLTLCWISERSGGTAADRWRLLRSSYRMSPNEGWIALKRNPFALGRFTTLPDDLAEDAVRELIHLVRSRLHAEAAEIIAGPGLSINKLLLRRLKVLDQADRVILAALLSSKNGFEDVARELGIEPPASRH